MEPLRITRERPMLLAGIRRHHPFEEEGRGIGEQWLEFQKLFPITGQTGDRCYGVICGAGPSSFEYMCGMEVESLEALPADMGRMRIHEQEYAVFEHPGPLSAIRSNWGAAFSWLKSSTVYQSAEKPDFEVYDERFDPQTGSGIVEIWIAVVPKQG